MGLWKVFSAARVRMQMCVCVCVCMSTIQMKHNSEFSIQSPLWPSIILFLILNIQPNISQWSCPYVNPGLGEYLYVEQMGSETFCLIFCQLEGSSPCLSRAALRELDDFRGHLYVESPDPAYFVLQLTVKSEELPCRFRRISSRQYQCCRWMHRTLASHGMPSLSGLSPLGRSAGEQGMDLQYSWGRQCCLPQASLNLF